MNNIVSNLENKIADYAQSYYEGNPKISDIGFDLLIDELREINPESKVLNKVGWGYDISKVSGNKVNHKYQLIGSLSKAKSVNQIDKSIISSKFVLSAKLDGLSAVAYYRKGILERAVTRGNGTIGIDITDKLSRIIPTNIYSEFSGAIRGELVISLKNWKNIKSENPDASHPRNYAAGIINRNDITDDLDYISFVPYNIIGSNVEYNEFKNILQIFDWLSDKFYEVLPHSNCMVANEDLDKNLSKYYEILGQKYPIDGLVITNINTRYDRLTKAIMYNQQAYKFQSDYAKTTVNNINWRLTRTNRLVPVLSLDPVDLCGATIRNCTAFNARYIYDNKITAGTEVVIERSNEVIPKVVDVINSDNYKVDNLLPKRCPICNELLEFDNTDLICNNPNCDNNNFRDLQSWIMNIGRVDGISWTLIEKFLDEFNIYNLDDLDNSKDRRFDCNSGTQKLLFNKVMNKLFKEPIDIVDALCALNIPRLGKVSAEKLATNRALLEEMTDYPVRVFDRDKISKLVGNATANSIIQNGDKFLRLSKVWDRLIFSNIDTGSDNIVVAVTGKLSIKRSDFEKELNNKGYIIGPVSKNCKFLITDNPLGSSSKNRKASELGIPKITESEFRKLYL